VSIDELRAENDARKAALAARDAEVAKLREEIEAIKRLMRRNSTNSSSPPSHDPPGVGRSKKPPTGKKRGGQPGHKGHARVRVAPERVDHSVAVPIEGPCLHCGNCDVRGRRVRRRHQTFELPALRAIVTEYLLEGGR
jgi:transposase